MAIGHRHFVGCVPRRNIIAPILCVLLFIVAWSTRLPRPPFEWLGSDPGWHLWSTNPAGPHLHTDIDLSDPEAPFIGWPLERLCNESKRVEGLVFICDNNSGGIGNIRNYIQTCLRYALEVGATGLTIPTIRRRNETDLADLFTNYLPFTYMFDELHFRDAFEAHCPHVNIYDNATVIPGVVDAEREIEHITPKDFGDREECHPWDQNRHAHRFGDRFRDWLSRGTKRPPPSANYTRLIRFNWGVLWDWQIWYDGPEFATTFGHVLKFNERLLRIGNTVLSNMHKVSRAQGDENGRFLGMHLRTESDAWSSWPTYHEQFQNFQTKTSQGGFGAAYLATGNAAEARRFATDAETSLPGMKVVSKRDLLSGEDLEELGALTFDQQGIVDFVVLLGSDFFVGTMPSSFSVYTAMKRHLRTGGLYTRPYRVGTESDGLSYVGGDYEKYWGNWLFMWDGMWP
ncbi:hypothetical protein DL767_006232 [Monosporascus sp. MG133]|nr:hypothetical protein DL767_006232 [Monosporascus sp. MG133]